MLYLHSRYLKIGFQFKMLKNLSQMRLRNLNLSFQVAQRFFSGNSEVKGKSSSKIELEFIRGRPVTYSFLIPIQNMHQVPRSFCTNSTYDSSSTNGYNTENDLEEDYRKLKEDYRRFDKFDENFIEEWLREIFRTRLCLSDSNWEKLMKMIAQSQRYSTVFDILVMKRCVKYKNLALANSYISYLETHNSKPSSLFLSYYMYLCSMFIDEYGETKVLEVYEQLCSVTKIFDGSLGKYVVLALLKTSKWREAFKYLSGMKIMSKLDLQLYRALIATLIKNGENVAGWRMIDNMFIDHDMDVSEQAILDCIGHCELAENQKAAINTFLGKLKVSQNYVTLPVAEELSKFFTETLKGSARYVKISNSGSCPACNQSLATINLDEKAFFKLREEYKSRVLVGSDIFQNSSPEEFSRYKEFVKNYGPFTIVVDGLNVGYSRSKGRAYYSKEDRMSRVKDVVIKLKRYRPESHILMIGRNHMKTWSPPNLREIKRRASVFFLDDMSQDDGFFIYAALMSGIGTKFVTRDLLRNHLFLLGDPLLRNTFLDWQMMNQIFVDSNNLGLFLLTPPTFDLRVQSREGNAWHVPYSKNYLEPLEKPCTWLCLQSVAGVHKKNGTEKI